MIATEQTQTSIRKRGTLIIPSEVRRIYGLEDGSPVTLEMKPEGILLRLAATVPVRIYAKADKAAFILNNTASKAEYLAARAEVVALGLDPDKVKHTPWK